jgi:3-dehydroquinate synthetase
VQLPTTLLAQVDASIGGKVAVNHPAGKNLIGSFHQPIAVVADLQTLATLPEAVYREGLAEVVKTAIVGGEGLVSLLEDNADTILARDPAVMTTIVTCCARVKAHLVEADERDTGHRMALNLGHTFAHAIEVEAGFGPVSHGHAVAVGLLLAAALAEETDFARPGLTQRTRSMIRALGLPTTLADLPIALSAVKLVEHLQQDKKRRDGSVRYVLARAPGDIVVRGDIDAGSVVSVLLRSERGEMN